MMAPRMQTQDCKGEVKNMLTPNINPKPVFLLLVDTFDGKTARFENEDSDTAYALKEAYGVLGYKAVVIESAR